MNILVYNSRTRILPNMGFSIKNKNNITFVLNNFQENLMIKFFLMNKHNQKPTDMFNKQDVTVYFIY